MEHPAPGESPWGTAAVLVDLDQAQRSQSDDSCALLTYFLPSGETVPTAPALPGLELIDSDPAPLAGQIIYLDFDGAAQVLYQGPITVGPFEVPAFQAPGEWVGQEQAIVRQTLAELEEIFAGSGVVFTANRPSANQPHSTIYVGGDDSAFAQYGSFLGLAEQVDAGNENAWDQAFVFAGELTTPPTEGDGYSVQLAQLIAHEAGHLLGYRHAGLARMEEDPLAQRAQTMYVDSTLSSDCLKGEYSIANRNNSGSDGNAYRTIEAAAAASAAGDILYLRAGTYTPTAPIMVANKTGTSASAKITFANYNAEVVTVDGRNVPAVTDVGLFTISNSNYIVLQGLHLTAYSQMGVAYFDSDHGEMAGLLIENMGGSGISLSNADYADITGATLRNNGARGLLALESDHLRVTDSLIHDNAAHGIQLRGSSYGTIDRNELYGNVIGVYTNWRDTTAVGSTHNLISNNLIHDQTNSPEENDGIAISSGSFYNTVRGNVLYGNYDDGIDVSTGSGAGEPSSNDYNTITDNIAFRNGDGPTGAGDGNGIKVSTNSGGGHLVAYNLSFDNDRGGFDQDKEPGYPQNFFYQNTAYNNAAGGFLMDAPSLPQNEDAVLYNNIAVHNGVSDLRKSNDLAVQDSDYNWWGDGQFAANMDAHSLSGDPQFNNPDLVVSTAFGAGWTIEQKLEYIRAQVREKFRLQAGSLAVDRGRLISGYHYSTAGVHPEQTLREWYGAAPDMGAYETALRAITDLSVSGTSQNSVTVIWTVPVGQDYRKPTQYDLRYASSPITEATWGTAAQVQGEPVPGEPGVQQSFTITGLNPGTSYYIAVKTRDELGNTSWLSNGVTGITATSGNHAPVFQPIDDQSTYVAQSLALTVNATDADAGDTLMYSAPDLPPGAAFDPAMRRFTWTPLQGQGGTHYATFQVTDSHVSVSQTIAITVRGAVNHAPVLEAIGNQAVNENTLSTFSVGATDEDGDTLTYSATGLPSGASFTDRVFRWTPNYSQAGAYQVTFAVSDGELTDSEQITITVANIMDETAPVAHDLSPAADAFQVPVNALIALTISDGGLGIDAATAAIQVNGQPVYTGDSTLYQSAYGNCRRVGTAASYRYYFQPVRPFDFDQRVSVIVTASDLAHNAMTPASYEFITEMRSFGRNQPVSSEGDSSGHPAVATDSQGNLWATWHAGPVDARDIYVAKRGSPAQSWDVPLRLTNLASDQCYPALAVAPDDALYVAWQDNRRGNWDIYVSVSQDGVTWGDPVRVTDSNDNQMNPVLAIDQADPYRVYVAWERGDPGRRDIYLASCSSSFVGKTIAQVTSDSADQAEPALAVGSDNTVYLLWADQRNGSADIYGSSSAASSWSNTALVTGPGNQSHPAVAAGPGTSALHMVWQSDATGNLDVLYGTSSGLPAGPFSGRRLIDDTTDADQFAPSIMAARDYANNVHVYACWQDHRAVGGTQDSDLYVTEVRTGAGGTNILVGDDGTNSNQSDPALGYDEYGQPAIVWTDSRSSVPRIYSACSTYSKPVALASALIARAAGGGVGVDPTAIDGVGDVSIQIPAGACDSDVVISISEVQNLPSFATSSVAGYEIGPSGVQFSLPATVTIPYASSGTGQTAPYWYDALTATLSQQGMTEITHRTLANGIPVLSFKTTHLTTFYILESPLAAGSSGGGGCALAASQEGSAAGFFLPYGALVLFLLVLKCKERGGKEA